MSWVRIWIHIVFSTKNKRPLLNTAKLRHEVFQHIRKNAQEKMIQLDSVGGYSDHIHCLIALGNSQKLSEVVQHIKGEASRWINKNKLTSSHFQWQDDYWAVSISEQHLERLRAYIDQQEEHHRTLSFDEELKALIKKNT